MIHSANSWNTHYKFSTKTLLSVRVRARQIKGWKANETSRTKGDETGRFDFGLNSR